MCTTHTHNHIFICVYIYICKYTFQQLWDALSLFHCFQVSSKTQGIVLTMVFVWCFKERNQNERMRESIRDENGRGKVRANNCDNAILENFSACFAAHTNSLPYYENQYLLPPLANEKVLYVTFQTTKVNTSLLSFLVSILEREGQEKLKERERFILSKLYSKIQYLLSFS